MQLKFVSFKLFILNFSKEFVHFLYFNFFFFNIINLIDQTIFFFNIMIIKSINKKYLYCKNKILYFSIFSNNVCHKKLKLNSKIFNVFYNNFINISLFFVEKF
jgi:hypothetical protein